MYVCSAHSTFTNMNTFILEVGSTRFSLLFYWQFNTNKGMLRFLNYQNKLEIKDRSYIFRYKFVYFDNKTHCSWIGYCCCPPLFFIVSFMELFRWAGVILFLWKGKTLWNIRFFVTISHTRSVFKMLCVVSFKLNTRNKQYWTKYKK